MINISICRGRISTYGLVHMAGDHEPLQSEVGQVEAIRGLFEDIVFPLAVLEFSVLAARLLIDQVDQLVDSAQQARAAVEDVELRVEVELEGARHEAQVQAYVRVADAVQHHLQVRRQFTR